MSDQPKPNVPDFTPTPGTRGVTDEMLAVHDAIGNDLDALGAKMDADLATAESTADALASWANVFAQVVQIGTGLIAQHQANVGQSAGAAGPQVSGIQKFMGHANEITGVLGSLGIQVPVLSALPGIAKITSG